MVRQPTDVEKLLLLVDNLHFPPEYHTIVTRLTFPKTINYGQVYRLLEFDKQDKMAELDRLVKEFKPEELLVLILNILFFFVAKQYTVTYGFELTYTIFYKGTLIESIETTLHKREKVKLNLTASHSSLPYIKLRTFYNEANSFDSTICYFFI